MCAFGEFVTRILYIGVKYTNDVAIPDIINTVLSIKEEDTQSILQEVLIILRKKCLISTT